MAVPSWFQSTNSGSSVRPDSGIVRPSTAASAVSAFAAVSMAGASVAGASVAGASVAAGVLLPQAASVRTSAQINAISFTIFLFMFFPSFSPFGDLRNDFQIPGRGIIAHYPISSIGFIGYKRMNNS